MSKEMFDYQRTLKFVHRWLNDSGLLDEVNEAMKADNVERKLTLHEKLYYIDKEGKGMEVPSVIYDLYNRIMQHKVKVDKWSAAEYEHRGVEPSLEVSADYVFLELARKQRFYDRYYGARAKFKRAMNFKRGDVMRALKKYRGEPVEEPKPFKIHDLPGLTHLKADKEKVEESDSTKTETTNEPSNF